MRAQGPPWERSPGPTTAHGTGRTGPPPHATCTNQSTQPTEPQRTSTTDPRHTASPTAPPALTAEGRAAQSRQTTADARPNRRHRPVDTPHRSPSRHSTDPSSSRPGRGRRPHSEDRAVPPPCDSPHPVPQPSRIPANNPAPDTCRRAPPAARTQTSPPPVSTTRRSPSHHPTEPARTTRSEHSPPDPPAAEDQAVPSPVPTTHQNPPHHPTRSEHGPSNPPTAGPSGAITRSGDPPEPPRHPTRPTRPACPASTPGHGQTRSPQPIRTVPSPPATPRDGRAPGHAVGTVAAVVRLRRSIAAYTLRSAGAGILVRSAISTTAPMIASISRVLPASRSCNIDVLW